MVLCAIAFGGGGYYFGTKKRQSAATVTNTMGGGRQGGQGGGRGSRMGGGFSGGEIISIDAESITVKGQDGSSKIVIYSPATPISKMASGTMSDLITGKSIMVNGKANPDGSITAETIQLRPEGISRQVTNQSITK